ncbi:ATP-binding cassette domain-containing protein [Mucilaginibacter myungsuensis]|uniref:ATP-binding cassette domain-containing protein n=1 Tax=Mucilaginibacter myungsuensis TaxID=649104 RepID=A0A929PX00_9SPHI|nr:ATP-binding cassette domain-containing protein [Mucilaginibacter myungsuensis]
MSISLQGVGRRFNREWIFRGVEQTFVSGESYAILGPNGSGKSTLLQVLNASLAPSAGTISFTLNDDKLEAEYVFKHIALAAPYMEVIEEFTLSEMIDFHFKFKNYLSGIGRAEVIALLGMETSKDKLIRYFSSGMKQRLKLALAFFADTPILMLDEPTSNLDNQGIDWYLSLIQRYAAGRLLIVCSNQEHEYSFCHHQLRISDYKQS